MYKSVIVFVAVAVCCYAAPQPKPSVLAAYAAAPVVAPAVVTAQSSQVVARNFNTLAAPLVAAAPVAPLIKAAPALAYSAPFPYVAQAAPLVHAAPALSAPLLTNPYSYYF